MSFQDIPPLQESSPQFTQIQREIQYKAGIELKCVRISAREQRYTNMVIEEMDMENERNGPETVDKDSDIESD